LYPLAHQSELLKKLVEQQKQQLIWGGAAEAAAGEKRIDWGPITEQLGRSKSMCHGKWNSYQRKLLVQSLKKGPFSPQEDATIIERVAAWHTSKKVQKGLWTGLGRELGRAAGYIQSHWRHVLSLRTQQTAADTAHREGST
jgi:hypothetical protein